MIDLKKENWIYRMDENKNNENFICILLLISAGFLSYWPCFMLTTTLELNDGGIYTKEGFLFCTAISFISLLIANCNIKKVQIKFSDYMKNLTAIAYLYLFIEAFLSPYPRNEFIFIAVISFIIINIVSCLVQLVKLE